MMCVRGCLRIKRCQYLKSLCGFSRALQKLACGKNSTRRIPQLFVSLNYTVSTLDSNYSRDLRFAVNLTARSRCDSVQPEINIAYLTRWRWGLVKSTRLGNMFLWCKAVEALCWFQWLSSAVSRVTQQLIWKRITIDLFSKSPKLFTNQSHVF